MLFDPKTLRFAGQLSGAVMAKGILLFGAYKLGAYLDKRFGTYPFLMMALLTTAGCVGLWYLIRVADRNKPN